MRAPRVAAAVAAMTAVALALPSAACGRGGGPEALRRALTTDTRGATSTPPTVGTTTTTFPFDRLRWRTLTPAQSARQEVAGAVVDGKVWVTGGLTANGAVATVEVYDPATDRWERGPALPVALHHHAAVTFKGELVVMGGFLDGADLYARPSDRVFALRGGAWVELPRLARPRGAAAAAVVAERIVLVGGRNATALIGPSEIFDGSAWQDKAPIPVPRDHLAAETDGRFLYAVGGRLLNPGRTAATAERFDPARDAWQPLADLPTARGGLGAAILAGWLVAAGGEDAASVFPQVEALDLAAGTWSALPTLPVPRHGLAVNVVGNAVYALVGGSAFGVAPSRAAEVISLP